MKVKEFYQTYLDIKNPFSHQLQFFHLALSNKFPILVKAPTGSGKTEMAIAPFLRQFVEGQFTIAPRLIYVLPMRVLVNTLVERIKKYVSKISPFISVKIQHGDAPNSPFFIADIVVTTLDQFLYGFARSSKQVGKHIDMPAGALASSLVIFDEAHMYRDEFTFSIMRALLEILYQSKIPFVVMTATMPESLEKSLFENIDFSEEQKIVGDLPIESEVKISLAEEPMYNEDEVNISEEILQRIKSKRTLIVVNQVKRAQRVYEEVKNRLEFNNNQIVLLHSRFTKKDREILENKALSLIPHKENGKVVVPEEVGIVISTQVLEAGIDFSAELLLTEVAPADALIQRAGRCARYKEENGEMIIFPVEDDKGFLPYERDYIAKTIEWLNSHPNFNIKDFSQACDFVNILDYRANDYEARDTLIDLYECVLYADDVPKNIQLRKNKPVKILIVEPKEGKNKKEQLINALKKWKREDWQNNSLEVDIKTAWSWFKPQEGKDMIIQWRLVWKYNEEKDKYEFDIINLFENKKSPEDEDSRIEPFGTYIIESAYYSNNIGIRNDGSIFI
ncbi:MAG TPA: CRISPR-associated helicase Cas3' [Candidatus Desulfofervidus auxilii]|uniref:CRISPR-associated helicase Cas3 n=1 Tax=Desulfofervidus auxilii TaxID=1621989 RepID=A0A7C1VMN4_DESA2|nr:CRISPR-associated helicase Cas3' [Candidatus Desulfofervidus auxilii]